MPERPAEGERGRWFREQRCTSQSQVSRDVILSESCLREQVVSKTSPLSSSSSSQIVPLTFSTPSSFQTQPPLSFHSLRHLPLVTLSRLFPHHPFPSSPYRYIRLFLPFPCFLFSHFPESDFSHSQYLYLPLFFPSRCLLLFSNISLSLVCRKLCRSGSI